MELRHVGMAHILYWDGCSSIHCPSSYWMPRGGK